MTDVLFYHLERQPLEAVLPSLVEKTLERGWRAVIEAGTRERVEALDQLLWTYKEESFLPHGTNADPAAEQQPIFLTNEAINPNGANVRFVVEGAALPPRPQSSPTSVSSSCSTVATMPPSPRRVCTGKPSKPPAAPRLTGSNRAKAAGKRRRERASHRAF